MVAKEPKHSTKTVYGHRLWSITLRVCFVAVGVLTETTGRELAIISVGKAQPALLDMDNILWIVEKFSEYHTIHGGFHQKPIK